MQDRIATLLEHVEVKSRVFYAGTLCSLVNFDEVPGVGHLHLLKAGRLTLAEPGVGALEIHEPSLIFFPRPSRHRLSGDALYGAELVCASIEMGAPLAHPFMHSLPAPLVVPLSHVPALASVLEALFSEAFGTRAEAQGPALNRLCELVLIYLLRYAMERRMLSVGVAAGLADSRLAKVLDAIHTAPGRAWTVQGLASLAGMSRARFAAHFTDVVGQPAIEYLTHRRIAAAQVLLVKGRQLKTIADEVGYGSPNALTRAFTQRLGVSPKEWVAQRARSSREKSNGVTLT